MENTLVVSSNTHNPYANHAIEEILLTEFNQYTRIFFMWINSDTVVFGRNQNPWREIDINRAESEGVSLIRRLSGGGAVFHDLGNLNYSFIESHRNYNETLHYEIICNAISSLGINLTLNERKDLLLEGHKISGNAFYLKGNRRLHHGTLLVNTESESIWKILKKKDDHIESKGISSVTSTVTSLNAVKPSLQMDVVVNSIVSTFYKAHQYQVESLGTDEIKMKFQKQYESIVNRLKSWQWTFGETPPFVYRLDDENHLQITNGYIKEAVGSKFEKIRHLGDVSKFNDQFKEV